MKTANFIGILATASFSVIGSATAQYSPTALAQPAVNGEAKNQAQIQAQTGQNDPRFQSRYGNVRRATPAQPTPAATQAAGVRVAPVVVPAAAPVQPAPQRDSRFTSRYGGVLSRSQPATPAAPAPAALAVPRVGPAVAAAAPAGVTPERHEDPGLEDRIVSFQRQNAISGNRTAQYDLGMRYLKGDGVTKDKAQAKHWLELSAKNGNGRAAKQLAAINAEPAKDEVSSKEPAAKKAPETSDKVSATEKVETTSVK